MARFHPPVSFPAAALLLLLITAAAVADDDIAVIPSNSSNIHRWMNGYIKAAEHGKLTIGLTRRGTHYRRRVSRSTVLIKAELRRRIITVRKDGSGNFRTVTEAVDSIPEGNTVRTIIHIGPGIYREKIKVRRRKPFVTLYGDERSPPTISFGDRAAVYGTWQSATVAVEADYFMACNIIFENSSPRPSLQTRGAQAVALRISGDMAAFYNCKFFGFQDTLLDDQGKHFFKDCFISGTVDFIFGGGRSIYMGCEIHSVADGTGVITAQGRRAVRKDRSGFSFVHCKITGTGTTFLGRAWRDGARVVFSYTYMDSLVDPKGWDDKGYIDRQRTVFYGEYKCIGPGAAIAHRVPFARILSDTKASPFVSMSYIKAGKWLLPPPSI